MITDAKLTPLIAVGGDPYYDLAILNNDLEAEEGLKTAILISLFTDRRVTAEELPPEERDRRGWWADALNADDDQIGSKLWLLKREKITTQVIAKFQQYCEEALQWLVDDGIAESVDVIVERSGTYQVSIEIDLIRGHDEDGQKYAFVWDGTIA
jgi:phage gp46-like protein